MSTRVAIVLNTLGLGGVPEVALNLLQNLPYGSYQAFVFILKQAPSEELARQVLLKRITGLGAKLHIAEYTAGRLGVIAELADWLQQQRIAILHTHSYRPNIYGRLAGLLCRLDGLRIVAHYHNQYDDKWQKNPTDLVLERHLANYTDAMLAVSSSVRSHVAERVGIAPERVELMLNGIEHGRFQRRERKAARKAYGLAADTVVVGLVGRICIQKGQQELVEAAALLAPHHPNLHFLIAGNAEDKTLTTQLHDRVTELGLEERIRFLGHQQDMPRFYAALDILAAPSRWEGFGLMLVEAMAAGLPIIATRVGAIPEVVQENRNALLVTPCDPGALAQAIGRLLNDPGLHRRLAEAGPGRAADFSWSRSGQQLHRLYQTLLNSGDEPWA